MYKIELLSEQAGLCFAMKNKKNKSKKVLKFAQLVQEADYEKEDGKKSKAFFTTPPFSGFKKEDLYYFKTKKDAQQWINEFKKENASKVFVSYEIRKVDLF
jgi:hypothetical protein